MAARLSALKPLLAAGGVLFFATAGVEIALRWHETVRAAPGAAGLTEPCRVTHHRLRPTRAVSWSHPDTGEEIEISANSHGLRGPEVTVPKPPGVYRVLCLGDETVLGLATSEPHTMPARLQELLQARTRLRVEVLNGGVPGDCPLLAWLRLRHSWLTLQPDLVLMHIDMSDIADDRRFRRHTQIDRTGTPVACPHPSYHLVARDGQWWRDLRLPALLMRNAGILGPADLTRPAAVDDPAAVSAWLRDNPPDWALYVQQSLMPLEDIHRAADGVGATFLVMISPQPWQVSADASAGPGVREAAGVAPGALFAGRAPFDAIAAFAAERGIDCCDTSTAFRNFAEPARLYLRNSHYLSRYGHELYARVVAEFLANRLPEFGANRAISLVRPSESAEQGTAHPRTFREHFAGPSGPAPAQRDNAFRSRDDRR
jgi:hypothetical protein